MRVRPLHDMSVRELAIALALGFLAALLLKDLGAFDILGFQQLGPWISICVAVALALALAGWLTALVVAEMAVIAVFLIVAFTPIVRAPVDAWVRSDPATSQPLDAVVVLSGWVKPDSSLEAEGLARLLTGLQLMKDTGAQRLITTRVVAEIDDKRVTSDAGQRRIIALAGLEDQWSEVDSVGTTHDEATRVAVLLGPGHHQIAVVTSPMHTRRACATFEKAGLSVRCVPARENRDVTWHPAGAGDKLAAFRDYVYERLGMIEYKYKGWLN